jgi:F420 biosynthesis protein FbiB-like protein
MDINEAIIKRRSIRAFKPDPVDKGVVKELLEAALQAPTGSNGQPWKFHVVGGEKKQELDNLLLKCLDDGQATSNELEMDRDGGDPEAQGKMATRRAKLMGEVMELLRENDIPVDSFVKGSFRYFGAPISIFITMDKSLSERSLVAVGAAVQNMLLAACAKGLGTCWIGMSLMYSDQIRASLGIADSERIVTSLALGHPDDEAPINSYNAGRDDFDEFVEWIGWE